MAGVTVTFEAHELAELGRAMRRAARAPLGPLMDRIAGVGEEATIERIDAGGPAPDGSDWPERHTAYENPHPQLNRDGGLLESIEGAGGETTAVWGSSLVYARIHQLGGTIVPREKEALQFQLGDALVYARSVTLPPRPYLGYGAAERQGVEDVIEAWLEEALGRD